MVFSRKLFFLSSLALFLILASVALRRIVDCREKIDKEIQARRASYLLQAAKRYFSAPLNKKIQTDDPIKSYPFRDDAAFAPVQISKALERFGYPPAFSHFFTKEGKKIVMYEWLKRIPEGSSWVIAKKQEQSRQILFYKKGKKAAFFINMSRSCVGQKSPDKLVIELAIIFAASYFVLLLLSLKMVSSLNRTNKKLSHELADVKAIDPFTNTYNSIYFAKVLEIEISRSNRYKVPFSLCLFDIDGLKMINDFFGREGGDEAIKNCAKFVGQSIRDVDMLFYLGNGQFSLLLPNTELSGGFILTERLRRALEATSFGWKDKEIAVCASFGVTSLKIGEDNKDYLLSRVEQLLQKAKQSGRNRVC